MGRLDVPVRVANPDRRAPAEEIELLVDTGATFTVLPSDMWKRLGLTAEFPRRLRTADGRVLERGQGLAYLELDGHSGTVPVIEGGDGDMPVLGVTTLEISGLLCDRVKGDLRPSGYLYL
jgi:predicted aspartyl protease